MGGWPIVVSGSEGSPDATSQIVRLGSGAIATSSTEVRQWKRAGQELHHIVDPRTGFPAKGPWRSATVAAATCAEANAASTAALVEVDNAASWLKATGLPARLVAADGNIHRFGSWPELDGGTVTAPAARMTGPIPGLRSRS